ncbi:hypothetical protein PFHG_02428 [Plasmodium falciparum HB3]|uniref:Uncharacterized protein n=1 Tax=Plasmodium falciparum (isolate HB3) TaxID=137071 RepID=A0A0L7KBD3_PLAFX|nr:hypothetical protein PFHG_02428 [Plasmodium falciparum HB3]
MLVILLSCLSSPVVRYVTFPCENVGSTPLADNFIRKVANRAAELPGGGRRNFFIKFLYNSFIILNKIYIIYYNMYIYFRK